jgi:hypothetical protein
MYARSLKGMSGPIVLDAITSPLPTEVQQAPNPLPSLGESETTSNEESSPVVPKRALDVLLVVLKGPDSRCPIEVRANICTLLGQLGRKGVAEGDREVEAQKMKDAASEMLQSFLKGKDLLAGAAKRTLEAWS